MITFIIILICVLLLCGVSIYYAYHLGEHHELHKIRAEFDDVLKHIGPSSRFRNGIELAEKIIDKMDANFNGDYVEKK